jgi:gluconate 2-dehydrogenase gamma chain
MITFISRRELLKRTGLAGAVAAVAPAFASGDASGQSTTTAAGAARPVARGSLEHLTAAEADLLDAVVARLIPSDASGPGALEAGATRYIDKALGDALASSRDAYASGLAALDQYARQQHARPFRELAAGDQDAVLIQVEAGNAPGFTGGSAAFFNMIRLHTLQGTFGDPYYGGNANFAGWDLIGYPGVRTIASPDEQRLGAAVPPNHKSAYDYDMFTKG